MANCLNTLDHKCLFHVASLDGTDYVLSVP